MTEESKSDIVIWLKSKCEFLTWQTHKLHFEEPSGMVSSARMELCERKKQRLD